MGILTSRIFGDFKFAPGNITPKSPKTFFVFGEHARELVSVESGLSFIENLCDPKSFLWKTTQNSSPSFQVMIAVNANPISRIEVEMGNYCLRTNENGVDLNRNWDFNWEHSSSRETDTFSGDKPFSEAETRILRDALIQFKPETFVSVHSGSCAYLHAEHPKRKAGDLEVLRRILLRLEQDGPHCPVGGVESVIKYKSPGTSLDYAFYVLDIPFTLGFEIYRENLRNSKHMIATSSQKSHIKTHQLPPDNNLPITSLLQPKSIGNEYKKVSDDIQGYECFGAFNPTSKEELASLINRWIPNGKLKVSGIDRDYS